jgi:hypothetical protein
MACSQHACALLLLLLLQVDCYALGCLLLECVTGERPWKGCNMVQVAYQVGGTAYTTQRRGNSVCSHAAHCSSAPEFDNILLEQHDSNGH